jgi:cytoskeleton protein RodZ
MNAAGSSDDPAAVETAQANSPEPATESLTPGELLRRERERRSITQLHIAEELHLDVRMVEAIETNRFEELGVPVYARGHLRQYATLLGLSPQLIIERYEAVTGRQEVPAPIPASVAVGASIGGERRSLAGALWAGLALIALVLGWWLWSTVSTPGDPIQAALNEELAVEAGSPGDQPLEAQPEGAPSATPVALQSAAPAEVKGASGSTPSAMPAADAIQLRLEFSEPSWTEIYDGTGKRLMFGLGESGHVRTVSGTPPLRITLGNASAVTVQVNDRPLVVPRRAGRDSTRFTITAGGAVQMTSGEVPVE